MTAATAVLDRGRPRSFEPARPSELLRVVRGSLTVGAQLAIAAAAYLGYAHARDAHGLTAPTSYPAAVGNAHAVTAVERWLHLPTEAALQRPFLDHPLLLRLFNGWYGGMHFAVTVAVLGWLLLRHRHSYVRWATGLAVITGVAVAVFCLLPTAPPRLLPPGQATVDTLARFGGLWDYDHGSLEQISDPYAAFPSLHLAWATWCAAAVYAMGRRRTWRRALACALYPAVTGLTVVVTGMHYLVDVVAGVALAGGVVAVATRIGRRRGTIPWRAG